MTKATPNHGEAGQSLRLFVRGFLRDHFGLSKIMADSAAEVFMQRWVARDPETLKRYEHEDNHTLAAAFDRRSLAEADRMAFGGQAMSKTAKVETEKGLREATDRPSQSGQAPKTATRIDPRSSVGFSLASMVAAAALADLGTGELLLPSGRHDRMRRHA